MDVECFCNCFVTYSERQQMRVIFYCRLQRQAKRNKLKVHSECGAVFLLSNNTAGISRYFFVFQRFYEYANLTVQTIKKRSL
jgi:hypothetical protein